MNKILKDPSHVANLSKFSHDMSQVKKFTSSVGQLLPVYYDLLYPGDKVRFSTEMFTQVTQIISPAMMHLEEHIDWFFVPLSYICQVAPDKLFGIDDRHSSLVTDAAMQQAAVIPLFKLRYFTDCLYSLYSANGSNYPTYSDLLAETDEEKTVDDYGVPNFFNYQRLFELLGFSRNVIFDMVSSASYNVNPMFACAYQKIFYDYYRITDRTANVVTSYNLDSYVPYSQVADTNLKNLFRLHYRPWKRDFFTNVKVQPLIDTGDIGMLPTASSNVLTNLNNYLSGGSVTNQANLSVNGSNINTATQRAMFAVEKLMEITRRARKHYDAQVKAHFGADVPDGMSYECYRLGSETSVFSINEVSSTNTNQSLTGAFTTQRGGKSAAYKDSGKQMSFTAKCHGVLMAVYSAVPNSDYRCDGLDKLNMYVRHYDFFKPEFDRLGMQPLYFSQFNFSLTTGLVNSVQGWTYRYYESKIKPNLVYGAFNTDLFFWSVARPFVLDKWNMNYLSDPRFYYVNPQALDDILTLSNQFGDDDVIDYDNCFARDPLLHWFKFNVYKSSVMSNFSLPQL